MPIYTSDSEDENMTRGKPFGHRRPGHETLGGGRGITCLDTGFKIAFLVPKKKKEFMLGKKNSCWEKKKKNRVGRLVG